MLTTENQSAFMTYTTTGERVVARKLIRVILANGWTISVYDGEEWTVKRARNYATIRDALATTGEDVLLIRDSNGEKVGIVSLVWGNDPSGEELIADYSANDAIENLINQNFN